MSADLNFEVFVMPCRFGRARWKSCYSRSAAIDFAKGASSNEYATLLDRVSGKVYIYKRGKFTRVRSQ